MPLTEIPPIGSAQSQSIAQFLESIEPIPIEELLERSTVRDGNSSNTQTLESGEAVDTVLKAESGAGTDTQEEKGDTSGRDPEPELLIAPRKLDFGVFKRSKKQFQPSSPKEVTLKNVGGGKLSGNITATQLRDNTTETCDWIIIHPSRFELTPNQREQSIEIIAETRGLKPGRKVGSINFSANVDLKEMPFYLTITQPWWVKRKKSLIFSAVMLQGAAAFGYFFPKIDLTHFLGRNNPPIVKPIEVIPRTTKRGDRVKLIARAQDPDGDTLKYIWESGEGPIEYNEDNHEVVWLVTKDIDTNLGPKPSKITLSVDDGHQGFVIKDETVIVNPPPTIADSAQEPKPRSPSIRLRQSIPSSKKRTTTIVRQQASVLQSQPPLLEPYRQSMRLFREGKYEAALEVCNGGLKLYPDDPDLKALKRRIENTISTLSENNSPFSVPRTPEEQKIPEGSSPQPAAEDKQSLSSSELVHAKMIRRVEPTYPTEARQAGISGTVIVEVAINEQGDVDFAKAIQGPKFLRQAAEYAATQSKFTAARRGGRPMRDGGTITYIFRLRTDQ